MVPMTFKDWFETVWRDGGEAQTRAMYRACIASGVAHMTVLKAIAGKPVSRLSARRLAALTEGKVSMDALTLISASGAA